MFIDTDEALHRPKRAGLHVSLFGRTDLLFLVLPFWLSAFAAFRPLAEPDEGRYTHIARAMVESGDWLIPRIDGLPFLHKPPLYFWMEALCIEAFGVNLWTARLPSLLAALVTSACVFSLVSRYAGERQARWSVAVLALSPLFFAAAQFANLDMMVSTFITLTLTLAVSAVTAPQPLARRLLVLAYVAAGLGVLSKGLIGAVLPGAIFVLWSLFERAPRRIWNAVSLPGIFAFLAVTVPWFLAVEHREPGFLWHFFVYHHFERFLTHEFNGQYGAWFYPMLVGVGLLPWSVLVLSSPRQRLRQVLPSSLAMLGLVWLGFVLVFFSLPASKMIGYIFPLMPAFAIVVGPAVATWRMRYAALLAAAILCLGLGIFGPHWQKYTPLAPVNAIADTVDRADDIVFMDHFTYDALLKLRHARSVYVYGDWSKPSRLMSDSLRRQLVEGSEFEPSGRRLLIGPTQLAQLIEKRRGAVWLIVDKRSAYPQVEGLPTVAEDERVRILRIAAPEADEATVGQ